MKLTKLGICGIISLLSYTAMVVFSPLAYPGYDWMSMAVSDLSAVGAPPAERYAPCGDSSCVNLFAYGADPINNRSKKRGG